ncbi:hypothetical protein [Dechloromonas sp. A34]|uniref:hypothetical protein n=1 Tax=Dechloromonas sp. A34 TaxID=447588 RepID=UPI0022491906|nr:hypothetical protein [Dechloromonas sp. A34]
MQDLTPNIPACRAWQNISLALGIKVVFLGLGLFGSATMWMAAFADMGANLLVVANGSADVANLRATNQSLISNNRQPVSRVESEHP